MNGEIRTTKELTHQSRVKLYLPTRLPWLTIKWSFSSYANIFNNLEAFVGQAVQGCKYCQAEILISIICKAYSVNIHKEFMNRNKEEITYFLSIVTISSICREGWGEYLVSLLLKCQVISFADFWSARVVLQHKECTSSVHREHEVCYTT